MRNLERVIRSLEMSGTKALEEETLPVVELKMGVWPRY
jgi:hypothetical protein